MRFIQTFKLSRNWNWHLIPFHLIVCVVYRVRPCPLYRVISWLSKHIHSIQVLGEHPCEIRSLFIHLLSSASPFFWQPCWGLHSNARLSLPSAFPLFIPLSVTLLLCSTSLNRRRGKRRECFCLSLIFEIAPKLGTSPWCGGVKEGTCSLLHAHRGFNTPTANSLCA